MGHRTNKTRTQFISTTPQVWVGNVDMNHDYVNSPFKKVLALKFGCSVLIFFPPVPADRTR